MALPGQLVGALLGLGIGVAADRTLGFALIVVALVWFGCLMIYLARRGRHARIDA